MPSRRMAAVAALAALAALAGVNGLVSVAEVGPSGEPCRDCADCGSDDCRDCTPTTHRHCCPTSCTAHAAWLLPALTLPPAPGGLEVLPGIPTSVSAPRRPEPPYRPPRA